MRRAEFVMALVMAVFSVYLMWKSAELPIGWLPDKGPGGGAFPFWLSAGMLLCCMAIMVRLFRRTSPVSQSGEIFMDTATVKLICWVAGSLTLMIALFHSIGVYFSVPMFLLFYMRFFGRHSWFTCLTIALIAPVFTFFFFEIALKITLPKGFTEPMFYPLYDKFL